MDTEHDTVGTHTDEDGSAEHEADDLLDWDLEERDRYMAAHEDHEEEPTIEVLVESDG